MIKYVQTVVINLVEENVVFLLGILKFVMYAVMKNLVLNRETSDICVKTR